MNKRDCITLTVAVLIGAAVTYATGNAVLGICAGLALQVIYGVASISYLRGEAAATVRWNTEISEAVTRARIVDPELARSS